jgi:hypothetical protein
MDKVRDLVAESLGQRRVAYVSLYLIPHETRCSLFWRLSVMSFHGAFVRSWYERCRDREMLTPFHLPVYEKDTQLVNRRDLESCQKGVLNAVLHRSDLVDDKIELAQ